MVGTIDNISQSSCEADFGIERMRTCGVDG
jgi:hypothetical protein